MSFKVPGKIIVHNFTLINNYGTSKETRTDVWGLIVGTSIYENIFFRCMYGIAKVKDSYNLYATLPITTNTYVYLRLQDPTTGKNVEGLYKIFKISNVEQDTTKLQTYIIHFVSVELFNSRRTRINEHVTGNIPSVIEKIHRSISNKPIEIDKEAAKTNIYLPMVTADSAITLLVENIKWRAATPDYCYWETFRGYNCKSISNCVLSGQVHDFSTSCKLSRDLYTNDFTYDDFIKISDYKVQQTFDEAKMLGKGYLGATIFSYDPKSGTSYFEATGDEPLAKIYSYADRSLDYTAISLRQQLLQRLCNTYYYIDTPGLLGRSSGDLADVTIYSGNNMNTKDTTLSGRRLICGIVHIISNDEYTQHVTLGDYYLG